jgi:hypothetical protein
VLNEVPSMRARSVLPAAVAAACLLWPTAATADAFCVGVVVTTATGSYGTSSECVEVPIGLRCVERSVGVDTTTVTVLVCLPI